jgi:hypothetical protein
MDVPDEPEVVAPAVKITKPVATPKPKPIAAPKASIPSPVVTTVSPSTDTPRSQSPAMNAPEKPATPPVSLASMSKEEKEIEMARRREERKAVCPGFEVILRSSRSTDPFCYISPGTENRCYEGREESIIFGTKASYAPYELILMTYLRPLFASLAQVVSDDRRRFTEISRQIHFCGWSCLSVAHTATIDRCRRAVDAAFADTDSQPIYTPDFENRYHTSDKVKLVVVQRLRSKTQRG